MRSKSKVEKFHTVIKWHQNQFLLIKVEIKSKMNISFQCYLQQLSNFIVQEVSLFVIILWIIYAWFHTLIFFYKNSNVKMRECLKYRLSTKKDSLWEVNRISGTSVWLTRVEFEMLNCTSIYRVQNLCRRFDIPYMFHS